MKFVTLDCRCGRRLDRLELGPRSAIAVIAGGTSPTVALSALTPGARRRRLGAETLDTNGDHRVKISKWKAATSVMRHTADPLIADEDLNGKQGVAEYRCRGCGARWKFDRVRLGVDVARVLERGGRRIVAGDV